METKKKGLIILNLGSPESFEVSDVKAYLDEFLMDERVIDYPWIARQIVVKGFITPSRAPKSAEAYKSVWTEEGSPLIVITKKFRELVQQKMQMPVSIAMRYGNPKPTDALHELTIDGKLPDEILVAPMYPHYAMSSYETAVDHIKKYAAKIGAAGKLKILKPFYSDGTYIDALAASIKPYLAQQDFDAVLFSYHGLPIRHITKTDPTKKHCYGSADCCEVKSKAWETCYRHQVKLTTKLVIDELQYDPAKVLLTFQSRLGTEKWIEPYTDVAFQELPEKGIKKLLVLCPAFVADCLETLEEIQIRGKESFIESGGEQLVYVPCLNTSPLWVETFAGWCNESDGKFWHLWSA
jgi:ferrochelatase